MQLTPLGAHVAQFGFPERQRHVQALISGTADINTYVSAGVCYDAAAYVRYLMRADAMITPNTLLDTIGQHWRPRFNFENGGEWDGHAPIQAGTAVGFSRGGTVFHAAIAIGGTRIRAVNGGLLGSGWRYAVDLASVLEPDAAGGFKYDRTNIRVHLSHL
ncbi:MULTISPECIES: type 6 secretion system effector deamidase TecA [Burkholderia]|uniref:Urea amidohydrolase n=2 Tax=Burkholderia TaxID=32008 RepID=A0A228IBY2_9BURK|nr:MULTISPECIES: type 6 secretion system effector deamidase TecA [Burkholderia]KER73601.1 urea amidohydrolase [Burkholderia cepacia]MBN3841766.1 urea amidohydrolase [Burkholderia sp. Ac-20349]MDN7514355.1 type 6 secretion system effector deamidase TecA [Burkholderia sp. AU45251]MDN7876106.1 type 6 secretion system effector deamidase TecA [Burkholderia aenigmatica]OXI39675.1 urea amidohydrolase [Burkholderia aenigmatica]